MIARNSIKVINTEIADKKLNRRIDVLPVGENALNNYLWDYENRLLKYLLLLVILFCLPDLQRVFILNACLECFFFYQGSINTNLWGGQTKPARTADTLTSPEGALVTCVTTLQGTQSLNHYSCHLWVQVAWTGGSEHKDVSNPGTSPPTQRKGD